MSHSNSKRFDLSHEGASGNAVRHVAGDKVPSRHKPHTVDRAIDAALRAVPLPDGLMTRLQLLACTMPEDMPDQLDWLGC
jgi:hypothetical protein